MRIAAQDALPRAMGHATRRGDFDTLLFLHEFRSESCTIQAAVQAHQEGHMDIFQWLVENYPALMKLSDICDQLRARQRLCVDFA